MAAAGAYILGCAGTSLGAEEARFFRDADPWGFILFDRNLKARDEVRRLTSALRDCVGRRAPILIDQEGGRVQRLRPPLARDWRPPLDQVARAGAGAERSMALRYRLIAAELIGLGIDVNCAPCADVATADTHPFLRNRCYGEAAESVTRIAGAVASGLMEGGVLPVLKHIPGHGRATRDSHLHLPTVAADAASLRSTDFAPFRALADLPLGMTAHVLYTGLDAANPATISPRMIALIREEIGFDGLLMTDDLSMEALPGSIGERSAAAIRAGCDVILHCNGDLAEMRAVVEEAGRMTPAAAARADRALRLRQEPSPIDIRTLEAELEALLSGGCA